MFWPAAAAAAAEAAAGVGADVQVWSASHNGFVQARVVEVNGEQVTVTWTDPLTGADMHKTLPARHPQLQWPLASSEPSTLHPFGLEDDAQPHPYQHGTAVEVWSNSSRAWLRGRVQSARQVDRSQALVTVLLSLPDGSPATKELPAGHEHLRLFLRPVCAEGTRCPRRQDEVHLAQQAHPFDADYVDACKAHGHEPVPPTLHGLFEWVDADGSGKVSRRELEQAMPLLSKLRGEPMRLSESAWKALDDDGNGAVNFNEFASWGGPRLGLPLGVHHLFAAGSKSSSFCEIPVCGIFGCLCTGFRPRNASKAQRFRRSLEEIAKWNLGFRLFMEAGGGAMIEKMATCECGHKQCSHQEKGGGLYGREIPCPSYWRSSSSTAQCVDFVPLGPDMLGLVQELLHRTHSTVWTRDRKKHQPWPHSVPRAYRVARAFRCENTRNWQGYHVRRAELLQDITGGSRPDVPDVRLVRDVKSAVAFDALARRTAFDHGLASDCNEWYLFHGTTPDAAEKICRSNVKLSLAGENTGTLYGRGLYCAESITKADEYSQPNAAGEYAVLICRVLGGRVLYTDELEPDPEQLVISCIEGPYDSVLGDREKCRGTYREFVFFDAENVYPEYIVHYRREF